MTVRADVVDLLLDCLSYPGTDMLGDVADWKHADSRPVTGDEAALLRTVTLAEQEAAIGIGRELEDTR
jgi:hypothetical protein